MAKKPLKKAKKLEATKPLTRSPGPLRASREENSVAARRGVFLGAISGLPYGWWPLFFARARTLVLEKQRTRVDVRRAMSWRRTSFRGHWRLICI